MSASSTRGLAPLLRRAAHVAAHRSRGRPSDEVRRPGRALGLRQVDAAGDRLRPARAERRARSRSAARADAAGRLAHCAYMPQRDLLLPWYSALDNAALALRNRGARQGRGAARRRARCSSASASPASRRARPGELSGGMRQRVAFLRTLVAGKPVLALDEPFASLDAITRAEMQEWLARGAAAPTRAPCVLVTHDVEEALYLADRVVVLSARPGRIVAELRAPTRARADRDAAVTDPAFVAVREQAPCVALREGSAMSDGACRVLLPAAADRGADRRLADRRLERLRSPKRSASNRSSSPRPPKSATRSGTAARCSGENTWVTLREILLGLARRRSSSASRSRVAMRFSGLLRDAAYPLTVASQAVPIVVIAPILVVWFGYGIGPKVVDRRPRCFFPITVNTLDGLALGRPRGGEDDAHARRLALGDLPPGRSPDRAAVLLQRRQGRRRPSPRSSPSSPSWPAPAPASAPDPPGQRQPRRSRGSSPRPSFSPRSALLLVGLTRPRTAPRRHLAVEHQGMKRLRPGRSPSPSPCWCSPLGLAACG